MYKDILVAIDHENESGWQRGLAVALAHCKAFGSRLHLLTVVQSLGVGNVSSFLPLDFEQKAIAKINEWIHGVAKDNVPADVPVQCIVGSGKVHAEILRVADEVGADLIVVGGHDPQASDYLIGTNAARVAGHAKCSVLVVRGGGSA